MRVSRVLTGSGAGAEPRGDAGAERELPKSSQPTEELSGCRDHALPADALAAAASPPASARAISSALENNIEYSPALLIGPLKTYERTRYEHCPVLYNEYINLCLQIVREFFL